MAWIRPPSSAADAPPAGGRGCAAEPASRDRLLNERGNRRVAASVSVEVHQQVNHSVELLDASSMIQVLGHAPRWGSSGRYGIFTGIPVLAGCGPDWRPTRVKFGRRRLLHVGQVRAERSLIALRREIGHGVTSRSRLPLVTMSHALRRIAACRRSSRQSSWPAAAVALEWELRVVRPRSVHQLLRLFARRCGSLGIRMTTRGTNGTGSIRKP